MLRRHRLGSHRSGELFHERRVARGEDDGHSDRPRVRRVQLTFADLGVVEPESLHCARPRVGEEAGRCPGTGVVAEEDRGRERRVEPLDHAERLDGALGVRHPRVELGVQQVLHVAVRVVDHDLGRPPLEDRADHRVHLVGHELAA